ncbi:MAG: hypothetical protein RLZZ334_358 [Actinomycetota bacterium]|jgi:hypothetical protein
MKKYFSAVAVASMALSAAVLSAGMASAAPAATTLVMSGGNGVFELGPVVINGTASAAGLVQFSVDGKVVAGCEAVPTATVTPFLAKCSWVPAKSGVTVITGKFTPTDSVNFAPATSNTLNVNIGVPVQGVVSPIHIYVDTVLASGTSGPLAPRFGVSCAIQSEYIVGQGIVFRVYANNADHGGAVMDSTNTAKAYIEIAGVKDPIQMSYGNHSGAAFWTGVLRTGTNPGQYNTLGVINYKITMVAKDSTTMKVLSTKLVPKMENGKRVIGSDGRTVYERVSYYRTVKLSVPLKGAVGTWQSRFMPASQLTLFALPKA